MHHFINLVFPSDRNRADSAGQPAYFTSIPEYGAEQMPLGAGLD